MGVERFEVYLVNLDPTQGSEIRKTRPCAVVSPNEMNRAIATVIIVPMTSAGKVYPSRVPCAFNGREALLLADQIRTVDKSRLIKRLGRLPAEAQPRLLELLQEIFAP